MTTTTAANPARRPLRMAHREEVRARLAAVRQQLRRLSETSSSRDTMREIRERNTELLRRLR